MFIAILTGQSLCPPSWVSFGDYCYEFNTQHIVVNTWTRARQMCKNTKGSNLVSILSQDEQIFLWQRLLSLKAGNIWIGLNDVAKEGVFLWEDRYVYHWKMKDILT